MRAYILLLTLLLSAKVYGQDYTKWNTSLIVTPSFSGILVGAGINREFGDKVELGLMPVYRYYKRTSQSNTTYTDINWGFQLSGRYYFSKENIMDPYISGLTGYLKEKSVFGGNDPVYYDYFIFGILLGNEINIGQRGWNFDFNVGLIGSQPLNNSSTLNTFPIYSLGIKKRFLKK